MLEAFSAAILLVILVASAAVGMVVSRVLPEGHRNRASIEVVQLVITMLVTFAALVMGLLTVSVKNSFDIANNDMSTLAGAHRAGGSIAPGVMGMRDRSRA